MYKLSSFSRTSARDVHNIHTSFKNKLCYQTISTEYRHSAHSIKRTKTSVSVTHGLNNYGNSYDGAFPLSKTNLNTGALNIKREGYIQMNRHFSSKGAHKPSFLSGDTKKQTKITHESTHRSLSSVNMMKNFDEFEKVQQTPEITHITNGITIEKSKTKPRLEALRRKLETDSRDGNNFNEMSFEEAKSTLRINNDSAQKTATTGIPSQPDVKELITRLREEEEQQKNILSPVATSEMLTDKYKRFHTYLRISLAERCNFRCLYCMPPEGVPLQEKEELLTSDEITRLTSLFSEAGVDKVRLTGGEPLLRPNLPAIISSISSLQTIRSVGITTNGLTLSRQLPALLSAGLTHINISLDTLHKDKFKEITRRNGFDKVMKAINDASKSSIGTISKSSTEETQNLREQTSTGRVKVNCVVMKGFNDGELRDFVMLTKEMNVDVRFIEWMPFHENGWNQDRFVSYKDMLSLIQTDLHQNVNQKDANCDTNKIGQGPIQMNRISDGPNDTTKWYHVPGHKGRIGFITSMSEHFCSSCNRLRITADGKLKVCLFGSKEVSLRDVMRTDDYTKEDLVRVINATVKKKTFALGGYGGAEGIAKANANRPMTLIGG